jgi:molybdopterin-guanine dinucleotide biosynthesis protein A
VNTVPTIRPAGVVLCGGRSSRFGNDKALALLNGVPLTVHVLKRLRPQVSCLFLGAQSETPGLQELGVELIPDAVQRHRGPLAGLYSAMLHVADQGLAEWLLLSPCDAPFLPPDLAVRLSQGAAEQDRPVSAARYGGIVQPTFSLWHHSVLPALREAVLDAGRGGLMTMLDRLPHATVDWAEAPVPPFFNVNTPQDLADAGRLLDAAGAGGRH